MSNTMAVLLNGIAQLEYDRDRPLTEYQLDYLDAMDEKMSKGIEIDGHVIKSPDNNHRIQFVTANLLAAINNNDEGMCSALCTFLANKLPDLKQIKFTEDADEVSIDLVFDEDYRGQAIVNFTTH